MVRHSGNEAWVKVRPINLDLGIINDPAGSAKRVVAEMSASRCRFPVVMAISKAGFSTTYKSPLPYFQIRAAQNNQAVREGR